MDNSYGKIRNFLETWTTNSEIARWADSFSEAKQIARQLVSDGVTRA